MLPFFSKLTSPKYFYKFSGFMLPWVSMSCGFLFIIGLVGALYLAPPDYQQGAAFRIIYIHVPCAFLSLLVYIAMAFAALVSLIWQIKLADIFLKVSAPLGACFTFLALVTGSLWGKPMWGTWWIWDARLTSELLLLFLYLGIIGLESAILDKIIAMQAVRILVLVGAINIPIIHYSVIWWHTLHQGATLKFFGPSLIDSSMLWPLIVMIGAFIFYSILVILIKMRHELIKREHKTQWVQGLLS